MSVALEIFEELYNDIKKSNSKEDIIQNWSSININIPSFSGKIRDDKIYTDYLEMDKNLKEEKKHIILALDYGVSNRKIKKVIYDRNDNPLNHCTSTDP